MQFPEYKYVDYAIGGTKRRNNVTSFEEAVKKVHEAQNKSEVHMCIYRYSNELLDYFKSNNNSVAHYRGACFADFVWIDIDRKDSPVQSLIDCQKLITILKGLNAAEHIRVYFSGSKGFHIAIPIELIGGVEPHSDLPVIFRFFVKRICSDVKVDFDLYRHLNLLRLNNTINAKSGLYKIRLTIDEVFKNTLLEIKDWAKTTREITDNEEIHTANEALTEIYRESLKEYSEWALNRAQMSADGETGDINDPPPLRKLCIWKLLRVGAEPGQRHDTMLRLAVHYQKEGFNKNEVIALITEWYRKNPNSKVTTAEINSSVKGVFSSKYDFGCFDNILDQNCDKRCYLYPAKMKLRPQDEKDLKRQIEMDKYIATVYMNFENYKKIVIDTNSWISLKPWLPTMARTVRGYIGGTIIFWIAFTGIGKSLIKDNFNKHIKIPSLNYELELPRIVRAERHLQNSLQMNNYEVEDLVKANRMEEVEKGLGMFEHVFSVDQPEMNVKDIEEYYWYFTSSWYPKYLGKEGPIKIPIINIDNLGDVQGGKGSNTYEQVSDKVRSLRSLSKKLNVAVQVFAHIKRDKAEEGRKEPSLGSSKDSSVIENIADMINAAWRPNYLKDNDNEIYLKNLKNRMGRSGTKVQCELILSTLTIREQKANEGLRNYSETRQLNIYEGEKLPF